MHVFIYIQHDYFIIDLAKHIKNSCFSCIWDEGSNNRFIC